MKFINACDSLVCSCVLLASATLVTAQELPPNLEGMWSDPPATPEDYFCYAFCTDTGINHLLALLDNPANDERTYAELTAEAAQFQRDTYIRPRLSLAALENFPLDPADDPGFLECEPWGFARQIFAPHQLEIGQYQDHVEFKYGEWEAERTIYLSQTDGLPGSAPTPMGISVGRYDGDSLVIETTAVTANITLWWAEHSEQLRAVERYTRSEDGQRLLLEVTMEDPWGLTEPITLNKVWSWSPDQEIFPYQECERPTEFSRGVEQ